MSLESVITSVRGFFVFAPHNLETLALFRIGIGLLLFVEGMDLVRIGWRYYSHDGIFSLESYRQYVTSRRLSIFFFFSSRRQVTFVFVVNLIAALCLSLGFVTPLTLAVTLGILISRRNRNPLVTSQGHSVATLMLTYLIFANSAEFFSVDRYLGLPRIGTQSAWPLRLMQMQVSIIYLVAVVHKIKNEGWVNGTVIYHVFSNSLPRRRWPPTPAILNTHAGSFLMGWTTIITQFALGIGLWISEIRLELIVVGIFMHVSMEIFLSIRLFQYVMILSYILFLPLAGRL